MLIDYMENADTLKYFDGSHDHRIVLKHQNEIIAKAVNNGDQVSISNIKATDDANTLKLTVDDKHAILEWVSMCASPRHF